MKHGKKLWILPALLLFCLFALRYYLAATGKAFWDDETVGLGYTQRKSYGSLFWYGSNEASPSPLFYILNKLLYDLYGGQPQFWWDLRVYNRILPATYWALACTAVFVWGYRRALGVLRLPVWEALVVGAGVAIFLHSCSFMNIYAIEDRAYSLWVSLSTVQLLVWFDLLRDPAGRRAWWRFGVLSALMVFTTFASLGQVGLTALALVVLRWVGEPRACSVSLRWMVQRAGMVVLVSAAIGFFYLRVSQQMHYSPDWFTVERYFESILEVMAKSYHHHGAGLLAVTLPLLFVVYSWFVRRDRGLLVLAVYNVALIVLTVVLFKGAQAKGGLWASRYVIFLIPSFTAHYVVALALFARWLQARLSKLVRLPWALFTLWAFVQIVSLLPKYLGNIRSDWPQIQARKVHEYTSSERCRNLTEADFGGQAVEEVNDACRGLAQ